MKKSLFWVLMIGLWSSGIHAAIPSATPDPKEEIIKVIQAQLDAFQQDDGKTAFSYASPGIQAHFKTPEIFMDMVIRGYQPVYRPQSVRFLKLLEFQGVPVQTVHVVGPDGLHYLASYPMEQQPDGQWKTAGCYLMPLKGASPPETDETI